MKTDDRITCRICNKLYKSLSRHVGTHKLKLDEYKEKFPGAPVMSKSLSESVSKQVSKRNKEAWKGAAYKEKMRKMRSEANKKNWKDKGYREARTAEATKRFTSDEFIDSVREVRRETGRKTLIEAWAKDDGTMKERSSKALKNWWEEHREDAIATVKKTWESSEFREKINKAVSLQNKERWKDPEFRKKLVTSVKKLWEDVQFKSKVSEAMKAKWQNEDYRKKMVDNIRKRSLNLWANETEKMLKATKHNHYGTNVNHTSPKAGTFTTRSKLEAAFAQQLDEDDNVVYYEYETHKVPYTYKGKEHTYILDFYVVTIDGNERNVELKPNKYAPCQQTLTKWATAEETLPNFEVLEFKRDE